MVFNSYEYIFIFLPVTVGIYFLISGRQNGDAAKLWLILASVVFYAWWDIRYLPIMVSSIVFNYFVGKQIISATMSRRKWLLIGLTANIVLLGYFKYTAFLVENYNLLTSSQVPLPTILLPLGISFFTITQIAFLVDCYEGIVKECHFANYVLFVSFFPHLLMGPILHHKHMMPQFDKPEAKEWDYRNFAQGLFLFVMGLFKKVVVADTFAGWVNIGFDELGRLTLLEAWGASLSYTLQLYYDFSGYSDMALGAALFFNIKLPINFNSPYRAESIIEFWQRWHISLTNFITVYLYTPIVRALPRITFRNAMIATFIAMSIAGLWHGASWLYILFYAMHSVALAVNHMWKRQKYKMHAILGWLITFTFVNVTLVLIRAHSSSDVIKVWRGMIGLEGIVFPEALYNGIPAKDSVVQVGHLFIGQEFALLAIVFGLLAIFYKNSQQMAQDLQPNFFTTVIVSLLAVTAILQLNKVSPFLYFKF